MARNFFDPAEPYAELRRAFVYKEKPIAHPAPPRPAPDPVTTTERASPAGILAAPVQKPLFTGSHVTTVGSQEKVWVGEGLPPPNPHPTARTRHRGRVGDDDRGTAAAWPPFPDAVGVGAGGRVPGFLLKLAQGNPEG